jgi:hypothetical protein
MKSIFFPLLLGTVALSGVLGAQTAVDLRAQSRNVDFSAAVSTKPFKTGAVLPSTCATGATFFHTGAPAGKNLYACTATNTWTALAGVNVANSGPGAVELLKSATDAGVVTGRQILTGEGTLITQQTDTIAMEVDTAVTPRYATAAVAPTGACQTGRDQFIRTAGFPHFYACVGGAWKPVYAVAGTAPSTCLVGELYFNSSDSGLYGCTAANTWTRFNRTGLDLTVSGHCFISYSCTPTGAVSRSALPPAAVAGNVMAIRVEIPHVLKLGRALMYATSGGANQSFAAAIYRDVNGVPGAKVEGSDLFFLGLSASSFRQTTWGTGTAVLTPAVYWLGFSSESSSALYHLAGGTFVTAGQMQALLSVNPAVVACSNPAAGAGATYTLPATCGTPSAVSDFVDPPIIVSAAQ